MFQGDTVEKLKRKMEEMDRQRDQQAVHLFQQRSLLEAEVQKKILPGLVIVKTNNGKQGVAFFCYQGWLMSNAHVISSHHELNNMEVIDCHGTSMPTDAASSLHRPVDLKVPDVSMLQLKQVSEMALPMRFTEDPAISSRLWFYYDMREQTIKYLNPVDYQYQYPDLYQHEDGSIPQPGSSGSPIIEARVVKGRTPVWQLRVSGILYGRCSQTGDDLNMAANDAVDVDAKCLCVVPIQQECAQIYRDILCHKAEANRLQAMSAVATSMFGPSNQDAGHYQSAAQDAQGRSQLGSTFFQTGGGCLDVITPQEDFEYLWYGRMADLSESLKIEKVFESLCSGEDINKYRSRVGFIDEDDLQNDYHNCLDQLKKNSSKVSLSDHWPSQYLRLDWDSCGSKKKKGILFVLQDNMKCGYRLCVGPKSLSSVFAQLKCLGRNNLPTGSQLAEALEASQKDLCTYVWDSQTQTSKPEQKVVKLTPSQKSKQNKKKQRENQCKKYR